MMQVDSIKEKFASIEKAVEQHLLQPNSFDNILRRQLHADIELLRLDLEGIGSESPTDEEQKIISDMDKLISKFPLLALKRKFHWWKVFESALRFVGAVCTMIVCAVYFSLIILVIRVFDEAMRVDPFSYYSQHLIISIAKWFWLLAGVDVTIEGLDKEYFDSPCTILSFTHVSNFDGFFVAGTCPIRLMAFGKKELFIVPLFGWFSLAIGGMPVDRNNRERAIGALHHLSESAKNTRLAIAISPEGTRSTTGHLLPFKKGAFYMWEELRANIVPMVILGAFELYPAKSWVNNTGKVTVRFLPPIKGTEKMTKNEVARLLRREQLLAIKKCPANMGEDISTFFWLSSMFANIVSLIVTYFAFVIPYQYMKEQLHLSATAIFGGGALLSILITFVLYVYYVYFIHGKNRNKVH